MKRCAYWLIFNELAPGALLCQWKAPPYCTLRHQIHIGSDLTGSKDNNEKKNKKRQRNNHWNWFCLPVPLDASTSCWICAGVWVCECVSVCVCVITWQFGWAGKTPVRIHHHKYIEMALRDNFSNKPNQNQISNSIQKKKKENKSKSNSSRIDR